MKAKQQHDHSAALLQDAGIRQTRQRIALAALLFDGYNKHVTAEQVYAAARKRKARVSLATVYNTLHQFTIAGLMHQVVIDSNRIYFDTNVHDHHHFFDEVSGELHDIPAKDVHISKLPSPPSGCVFGRIDVVIRVRGS